MTELSEAKVGIAITLLLLIAASIACNHPLAGEAIQDAMSERCVEIDRSTYETLAAELGQTPETPKYPESAVYEACTHEKVGGIDLYGNEGKISSVRMSEGYRPEEENKIPAGTYTGETLFYTTLEADVDDGYLDPVCTENTVRVVVASDGTANGEVRSFCTSSRDTDNEEMRTVHHSEVAGMIQGELPDRAGQLSIDYTWHSFFTSPQWEAPSLDQTVDFVFQYNVQVIENVMTLTPAGEVEDYYSFTLHKE